MGGGGSGWSTTAGGNGYDAPGGAWAVGGAAICPGLTVMASGERAGCGPSGGAVRDPPSPGIAVGNAPGGGWNAIIVGAWLPIGAGMAGWAGGGAYAGIGAGGALG